ncbi:MAG: GNAT family N-acetyltransferase [Thermodesulfobacteriota bacterium]
MARVVVRAARPEDAAPLTRIAHAAKRHWGYPEAWIAAWREDLTVDEAACAAGRVFCACDGDEPCAFYALERDGDRVSLEHMWVEPARMGAGIGAVLFAHAVETARRLGGRTLEVASDPHAEGFYLRMGARRRGDVPSFPPGRRLPLLELDLASGARQAQLPQFEG